MTLRAVPLFATLLLGLACSPEGVIGKDTDGASSNSGGGSGETSGHGTGHATSGGGSGTHGGSGGDTGLACPPHEPTEPCGQCLAESCCMELQACTGPCACIRTCVADGHSLDACKTDCGDDGGAFDALHTCEVNHCGDHCP